MVIDDGGSAYSAGGLHDEKAEQDATGIVPLHAYTLLDARPNVAKSGFDLIQLRNTWADEHEWNGDWSDGDEMWVKHPAVYKEIQPENLDNGIFWMSKEDFARQFRVINCCLSDSAIAHRESLREKLRLADNARAARFVAQLDKQVRSTDELVWMQGSREEAAAAVEADLNTYAGYTTKAGVTHGVWLLLAPGTVVKSANTGVWTVYLHQSVVEAEEQKRRAREQRELHLAAHFVAQPDMQVTSSDYLEWMQGSQVEAAALVEANLSKYTGYMTKAGVGHGVWLLKVGSELRPYTKEMGVWIAHTHATE